MTDHLTWETVNDLVDGVLSPAESARAEWHAGECPRCAKTIAELRATVSDVRELPQAVAPPADLWNEVRATIESGKVAHLPTGTGALLARGWWVTPQRLAAAAVVLMAVTATLTSVALNARQAPMVAGGPPVVTVSASWQASERAFQASVLELRAGLEVLHDHLAPETLTKVERALATIDLAIAEGREALLRDPANAALSELVASNYRQKIELLRRLTQLASTT
jgi:anti-sigma factor RsiW